MNIYPGRWMHRAGPAGHRCPEIPALWFWGSAAPCRLQQEPWGGPMDVLVWFCLLPGTFSFISEQSLSALEDNFPGKLVLLGHHPHNKTPLSWRGIHPYFILQRWAPFLSYNDPAGSPDWPQLCSYSIVWVPEIFIWKGLFIPNHLCRMKPFLEEKFIII